MRAVRVRQPGGPEVLRYEELPTPEPKAGEALVELEAAGVNFIDIYKRAGLYKLPLPATLGEEGAGKVVAVGDGVTEVRVGDRVAWASVLGSYAEYAIVPAARLGQIRRLLLASIPVERKRARLRKKDGEPGMRTRSVPRV
jgi:NADPH2:quinone reductase